MSRLQALLDMDAALERAGFHPLTPWWKDQLRRWYAATTATTLVGQVGRGGIKSTTAVKVAVAEVLFGDWHVPPGEVHYFAFVSASKAEALQRLRLIEAMLTALRVGFDRVGDEIQLRDLQLGFRAFSASVGAVSGFRCIGFVADELAKWRSADEAANPAREVIASLRAMCVTHQGAREFMISSPLARVDFHYESVAAGDTRKQLVCSAPTWVANPSITEEQTRELEPDERIWRREYAAIPQDAALSAFDADAVERAFRPLDVTGERGRRILVLDPSSGRKDAWTWGVCGWVHGSPSILRFDIVDGIEGSFFRSVSSADVVVRVAGLAKVEGIASVHADQREAFTLASAFHGHELTYSVHDWTSASKPAAVERLRRWLAEGRVSLPEHRKLRQEMLAFEERVTPNGAFTFGARGSGHDDYVALLITAVMAIGDEANGGTVYWDPAQHRSSYGVNEPPMPYDRSGHNERWSGQGGRGFG